MALCLCSLSPADSLVIRKGNVNQLARDGGRGQGAGGRGLGTGGGTALDQCGRVLYNDCLISQCIATPRVAGRRRVREAAYDGGVYRQAKSTGTPTPSPRPSPSGRGSAGGCAALNARSISRRKPQAPSPGPKSPRPQSPVPSPQSPAPNPRPPVPSPQSPVPNPCQPLGDGS